MRLSYEMLILHCIYFYDSLKFWFSLKCPQQDVLTKREREESCSVTVYLTSFVYIFVYI